MKTSDGSYTYLLNMYNRIDGYLSGVKNQDFEFADIVVSFCIVSEKMFTMMLHKQNPVLVFDHSKMKEADLLIAIVEDKQSNIGTVEIREMVKRYNLIFKGKFSEDEVQALISLYALRNELVHGYRPDDKILVDEDDILKKMGTLWGVISSDVVSFFGDKKIKASKPKNKYTHAELENILIEEVKKKINSGGSRFASAFLGMHVGPMVSFSRYPEYQCPRCGNYGFSVDDSFAESWADMYATRHGMVDIYKCKKCNLELTGKEFEIAKTIRKPC